MLTQRSLLRYCLLCAFAFSLCFSTHISAATITSTAAGGSWSTGTTWVGGAVPLAGDDVIVATSGSGQVSVGINATCGSLSIQAGAALAIGSRVLRIAGNVSNAGSVTLTTGSITQFGTGDFTNSGIISYSGAGLLSLTGSLSNTGILVLSSASVHFTGSNASASSVSNFTTTGNVSFDRTAGTVTATGNIKGAGLTINGSGGTLNLGAGLVHSFTGKISITAGTLIAGSSVLNITYIGTAFSNSGGLFDAGTSTVNFGGTGDQTIEVFTSTTFNNLTLSGSGTKMVNPYLSWPSEISGVFSIEGTVVVGGFAPTLTSTSTIQYKGTSSRTTGTEFPNDFAGSGGVIIDQGSHTVTLNANKTALKGDITVKSGTFDLLAFTADRSEAGGTLTVANGASLKIGGTNTLPSNYSAHSIGCTSTIEYAGSAQTIAVLNSSQSYGNLILSGSSEKTLQAGMTSICNNFILSGTSSATSVAGLTVGGSVDIQSGATYIAGAYTHFVGGNWTKNGVFSSTGSTINFNSANSGTIGSCNFNNVTFSGTGAKSAAGALSVSGDLLIANNFAAGSATHTIGGNWTNNGTFASGTSTISFINTSEKEIGGTSSTVFNHLSINGAGGVALRINTTVSNILSLITGNVSLGNHSLSIASVSGGTSASYVKTNGTGLLSSTVVSGVGSFFPVGDNAFNPITITNTTVGNTDNYGIRVVDGAITNSNANQSTISRKWHIIEDVAGGSALTVVAGYNAGEAGTDFNASVTPSIGYFNGTYWYVPLSATVAGTDPFTFSSGAGACVSPDLTSTSGFFCLGSADAYNASRLSISAINPASPFVNQNNGTVTVQSLNSSNVPSAVSQATTLDLSAANTALSVTPTGTISANEYSTELTGLIFTIASATATLTASATAGDLLLSGTSGVFSVITGTLYKPSASGNWSTVQWQASTDGGASYSNSALPAGNAFAATDEIFVPAGITLDADVAASFFNLKVDGHLNITPVASLTLNHSLNADYGFRIFGAVKNSGGTFINSNTAYPIVFLGGTYNHALNGGTVPLANWTTYNGTPSTCQILGITNTAVTSGLDQRFQNFTWNNASQAVVQGLSSDLYVDGMLALTNGVITTGPTYHVVVAATGNVSSTNNARVNGNIRRYIPDANAPTVVFPIGDAAQYSPVSISFAGSTAGSGYIDASAEAAQPPAASGLSHAKYVNRRWILTNTGVSGFTTFSPIFTFTESDKVGAPDHTAFAVRELVGTTWSTTAIGTQGANATQCTGLNDFGTFAIGEDACIATNAIWLGGTSTDWNTASNWCGGSVPTASIDVFIPAGAANQPVISNMALCNSITIEAGARLSMGSLDALIVFGDWTMNGTFVSGNGAVWFAGSSVQTITGATSFANLTIFNSMGVTAASDLTVTEILDLQTDNASATCGTLDMGNNTLYMGEYATTIGMGEVTGTITRTHTFALNTPYSCGHENSFMVFSDVSGQTLPASVSLKVTLGTAPAWNSGNSAGTSFPTLPLTRIYDITQIGGSGTSALMRVHYRDNEVEPGINKSKLTLWHRKKIAPGVYYVLEVGKSNFDVVNNYLTIQDIDLANIPSAWGEQQEAIAPTQAVILEWTGAASTDWNNPLNWYPNAIPSAEYGVLIPDAASTPNDPILPAGTNTCVSVLIESGGILNSDNLAHLVLVGSDAVWSKAAGGVFNYGNSTVTVANTYDYASFVGNTDFYNVTIADGSRLKPAGNSYMGIVGALSLSATGILDAVTNENEIEFKGGNQLIPNPNGSMPGYHNLILSGSGTKTLPAVLDIADGFTNNGTVDAGTGTVNMNSTYYGQAIGGSSVTTFYSLTINNANGVTLTNDIEVGNLLTLTSANPSATQGALHTGSQILTMLNTSATDGDGEVTGYVKRTSFNANTAYTFGHKNTSVTFTSATTFPADLTMRISIGASPSWKPDAINRVYDLVQHGGNNCWATARTHYLESELNGISENEFTFTTNGANGQQPDSIYEWGRSNYDLTNNWIELSNINLADFPTSFGDLEVSMSKSTASAYLWNGSVSTDWNTMANWTPTGVPIVTASVIIPNAVTTTYSPNFPASTEIKSINIDAGGIVNGGAGTIFTLNGASGAWNNIGGTFNAGTSTVIFSNTGASAPSSVATISGATNFYNVTIPPGATVILQDGSMMGIAGSLNNTAGTGILRTVIGGATTVDYNGGNQTVVVPNPATHRYYNLVLSGSGTKTMPAEALDILGDFTVAGTAAAAPNNDLSIAGDMSIGAGATFSAGSNVYTIGADFTNAGTFTCGTSTVALTGSQPQIIKTGGDDLYRVVFNNTAAGTSVVDVQDPLAIVHSAEFTRGVIAVSASGSVSFMDGATCSGASAASFVEAPVTKVGNTAFSFPIGNASYYAPISISDASGTGSSTDSFTAQYFHSNPSLAYSGSSLSGLDHISSAEYWVLNRIGSNSVKVTTSRERSRSGQVTDLSTLAVAHWDGTQWTNAGNTDYSGTADAGTLTSDWMASFSPIADGSTDAGNPLPISLTSFDGYCTSSSVVLNWSCASEMNNDYFTLERSADLHSWEFVATVQGAGNSSAKTSYSYEDTDADCPGIVYYRLHQTDFDGNQRCSDTIPVKTCPMVMPDDFLQVHPNPFNENISVKYHSDVPQLATITVTDIIGNIVYRACYHFFQELDAAHVHLTGLTDGVYVLNFNNGNKIMHVPIIKH